MSSAVEQELKKWLRGALDWNGGRLKRSRQQANVFGDDLHGRMVSYRSSQDGLSASACSAPNVRDRSPRDP